MAAPRAPASEGAHILPGTESESGDAASRSVSRPRRAWAVVAALAVAGAALALISVKVSDHMGHAQSTRHTAGSLDEAIIVEAEAHSRKDASKKADTRKALMMPDEELPSVAEASNKPKTAQDLWAEVEELGKVVQASQDKVEAAKTAAEEHAKHAKEQTAQAKDTIQNAKDVAIKAKQDIEDAQGQIKDASTLREQAKKDGKDGSNNQKKGEADLKAAKDGIKKAKDDQVKADDEMEDAKNAEEQALKDTADGRACVDVPGVRLHNWGEEKEFRRVVEPKWYPKMDSMWACSEWCKSHADCRQATFSYVGVPEGGNPCHLFEERGDLYDFREDFNASWCGTLDEIDYLVGETKKVFKQKPWVGENKYGANPCGFGGDDCSETKCCGTQKCNWDFTECEYFKCYKKDEDFAGCLDTPDPGWEGTVIGAGPPEDDLPAAEEGKLAHPTSLFCFTVAMPGEHPSCGVSENEGLLVQLAKDNKASIYSCDDQMVIEGWEDGGGSEANIDVFIQYWKKVKDDGRYLSHDWLIKADADCVFLADRVKAHIDKFRPPAGAAVFFKNVDFRFHFMGAFEMMSREGAQVFFEGSWQCDARMGHKGGEDYWMMLCLETLGLRRITDYGLLADKYAAVNGCTDSWAAAFHFYKTKEQYMGCLDELNGN